MRGLVFALVAAAIVALVQGHRYRGPRYINLGITGVLAPVNAGHNRETLSRFGSISGSSLSRTFGSTILAGSVTGGQAVGLSSVYPITARSTSIRGVAPFSGGFQSYTDFGGVPSVPGDGPYGFDGPSTGFGLGGDDLGPLGSRGPLSGDRFDAYPGDGPYDGVGPLGGSGPYNDIGPQGGSGPYNDIGPLGGSGPYDDIGPLGGSGPYNDIGPLGGSGPYNGPRPLDSPSPYDDLEPLSDGRISEGFSTRGYRPLGYNYETSLSLHGADSVYEPYRGLGGVASVYPNSYDGLDGSFDLGDRFSSSGFRSSFSRYIPNFPYDSYAASRSGRNYDLDSRGGYEYLYNYRPGASGFGSDFSVSSGGPRLDINFRGGDGLGFNTQFGALEGQGALGRGTGSVGLDAALGSPGPNLAYNTNA